MIIYEATLDITPAAAILFPTESPALLKSLKSLRSLTEMLCDFTRIWNTFLSSLRAGKWMCRVLLMLLCCHITPEMPVKFYFFSPWSAVRKVSRRRLIALLQRWRGWQRRNSCIINGIAAKRHADELWVALAPREFVLLIEAGFTQADSVSKLDNRKWVMSWQVITNTPTYTAAPIRGPLNVSISLLDLRVFAVSYNITRMWLIGLPANVN